MGNAFNNLDGREWHRFDFQLAGLDFGKIQNVIDDGEEGFTGVAQDFQVLSLFLGALAFQQEVGHAQYAIHGRSDFVGHRGQEVGFRPTGGFGRFFRFR